SLVHRPPDRAALASSILAPGTILTSTEQIPISTNSKRRVLSCRFSHGTATVGSAQNGFDGRHRTKDLKKVVVVVGPQTQLRRYADRPMVGQGIEVLEETGVPRDQHPIGGGHKLQLIVAASDPPRGVAHVIGEELDDRRKI